MRFAYAVLIAMEYAFLILTILLVLPLALWREMTWR